MADIKLSFPIVVSNNTKNDDGFEGIYSNDPNDKDGLTVYGLEEDDDSDWDQWSIVNDIVSAGGDIIGNIIANSGIISSAILYHKNKYWDVFHLDKIDNQTIATELYNAGINIGMQRTGIIFHRALNTLSDNGKRYNLLPISSGNVGSMTLSAYNNCSNKIALLKIISSLHMSRYVDIGEDDTNDDQFEDGWVSRPIFAELEF